jgi:putative endonuclease
MRDYSVYILASKKNGTLYVGVTSDLARRLEEHRAGGAGSFTGKHYVRRLVHLERFPDPESAIRREKALKHWSRAWKVALIERANPEWHDLVGELW